MLSFLILFSSHASSNTDYEIIVAVMVTAEVTSTATLEVAAMEAAVDMAAELEAIACLTLEPVFTSSTGVRMREGSYRRSKN
jgi:adenosylmethionine-8-amino-7-oxononanoate aminotransferase